jgi:hypothetical protein
MLVADSLRYEDANNPRTEFPEAALEELAADIQQRGVLQPLVVHPTDGEGRHRIHFGAKRLRAAIRAGLHEVPVVVRDMPADRYAQVAENQKRHGPTPVEIARFIRQQVDAGDSNATIARHPATHTHAVRRVHAYSTLRPLVSLGEAIAAASPDLVIPCDDSAAVHLGELYRHAARSGAGHDALRALLLRSLGEQPWIVPDRDEPHSIFEIARQCSAGALRDAIAGRSGLARRAGRKTDQLAVRSSTQSIDAPGRPVMTALCLRGAIGVLVRPADARHLAQPAGPWGYPWRTAACRCRRFTCSSVSSPASSTSTMSAAWWG